MGAEIRLCLVLGTVLGGPFWYQVLMLTHSGEMTPEGLVAFVKALSLPHNAGDQGFPGEGWRDIFSSF